MTRARGRAQRGRECANRALLELPPARPLLHAVDHGDDVRLTGDHLGVAGDRSRSSTPTTPT
jgi:hypothetical protein